MTAFNKVRPGKSCWLAAAFVLSSRCLGASAAECRNDYYLDPVTNRCSPCTDICNPGRGTVETQCVKYPACKDVHERYNGLTPAPWTNEQLAVVLAASATAVVVVCVVVVLLVVFNNRRQHRQTGSRRCHLFGQGRTVKPVMEESGAQPDAPVFPTGHHQKQPLITETSDNNNSQRDSMA